MARKIRSGVYRCQGGFCTPFNGQVVTVPDGALVPHEFPYEIMDGREHLFDDVSAAREPEVEEATAAPGEKRSVSKASAAPKD
jgi:hypothetical protein